LTALLSNGHYYAREFDKAIKEGLKAVESQPAFPVAHACLGQALTQIGRFSEAIQHFELARGIYPGSIMLGLLGYAYGRSEPEMAFGSTTSENLGMIGLSLVFGV